MVEGNDTESDICLGYTMPVLVCKTEHTDVVQTGPDKDILVAHIIITLSRHPITISHNPPWRLSPSNTWRNNSIVLASKGRDFDVIASKSRRLTY